MEGLLVLLSTGFNHIQTSINTTITTAKTMVKISRYKFQALVLIILSLIIMVVISRLGISSVLGDRKDLKSIELSQSFNSNNAEVSYRLARIYQLLSITLADEMTTRSVSPNLPCLTEDYLAESIFLTKNLNTTRSDQKGWAVLYELDGGLARTSGGGLDTNMKIMT